MLDPTGLLCPGYTSQSEGMSKHAANSTSSGGNYGGPGGDGSSPPPRKGAAGLGPVGDFLDKAGNFLSGKGWRLNTDEENAARALRARHAEKGYITEAEIRRVCEKYGIIGGVIGGFAYEGLSDVYALAELMSKYRFSWDPIGILNFIRFGYDYVSSAVTIAEMVFTSDKTEVMAFLDEMKDGLGEQFVQPFIDIYNTFDSGGITVENSFEFGRDAYRALSTIIIAYSAGKAAIKGGTKLLKAFNSQLKGAKNFTLNLQYFANKRDIKQIEQVAKKMGLKGQARHDFGDYVESLKTIVPNNKNFTWKELIEIAKEFMEK